MTPSELCTAVTGQELPRRRWRQWHYRLVVDHQVPAMGTVQRYIVWFGRWKRIPRSQWWWPGSAPRWDVRPHWVDTAEAKRVYAGLTAPDRLRILKDSRYDP
jgi:hypothetical protein